jgi:hypothetical protein
VKNDTSITAERLRELLRYEPETGRFFWLERSGRGIKKSCSGSLAGNLNNTGYRRVTLDRKMYLEHRLAWFWVHGEWPEYIDHINRDRSDNRISNLRPCSMSENLMNTVVRKNNKTGITGIHWDSKNGKWQTYITKDRTRVHLGQFDHYGFAVMARRMAESELFGSFMTGAVA